MMRRHTVLVGTLAMLVVRPARAETCSSRAVIHADASVTTRWPGLLDDVREAFAARDDVDRCARVELSSRDASIRIEVTLPDGRSASRSVAREKDVVPTLEALLVVPERPEIERASAAPEADGIAARSANLPPATWAVAPAPGVAAAERAGPTRSPARAEVSRVRLEVSALTSARIGDGQAGVGLGALSFVELSGWLMGFGGRVDRYRTLTRATDGSGDAEGALEISVLGGRRFMARGTALDIAGGLAAAIQESHASVARATNVAPSTTRSGVIQESSSTTAPRLLVTARASFDARATVHTFVSLDGEIGATGAERAAPGAPPLLPIWTLGLSLGATVGTR